MGKTQKKRLTATGFIWIFMFLVMLAGCSGEEASYEQSISADTTAVASAVDLPSSSKSMTQQSARMIIYEANLFMRVSNYDETVKQVQQVIDQSGGYVLQSDENTLTSSDKNGEFVIKIPAASFKTLISQLEVISPVQKSIKGQEVTEEFVDLQARLKVKLVAESRLLSFMETATKTDDLVSFSNELAKVQEEIERIKGRMRYLEENVAVSTVKLSVTQKATAVQSLQEDEPVPLLERAVTAFKTTTTALLVILDYIIIIIVGALPVVGVALLIGVPIWWFKIRKKKEDDTL